MPRERNIFAAFHVWSLRDDAARSTRARQLDPNVRQHGDSVLRSSARKLPQNELSRSIGRRSRKKTRNSNRIVSSGYETAAQDHDGDERIHHDSNVL